MWAKYTAKWGVQMMGMNFQTHSRKDDIFNQRFNDISFKMRYDIDT
ncbi:DUF6783 domain-containing protein [Lachnospiraceae bacterium 45-P1]